MNSNSIPTTNKNVLHKKGLTIFTEEKFRIIIITTKIKIIREVSDADN
jgi:hypothetical protein